MKKEEIICIGCPIGCPVAIRIDGEGNIAGFEGNECKIGEKYVAEEFRSPVRVFTGTVRTRNCSRPLLAVRTSKPIPKKMIPNFSKSMIAVEVSPPVRQGDIIVSNISNSGVDLIATGELKD
jgi:CxxC motif-containing protein